VRRIVGGLLAFLVLTGTFLVLPVYAAPTPQAEPVAPSIDSVDLGSVDQPVGEAVVTDDRTVVDAGPQAPVGAPAGDAPSVEVPVSDKDRLASSGDEVSGVPALTISRPSTDHFASVGVTWAQDAGVTDVTVQLRTRAKAGGAWGAWTNVQQDDVGMTTTTGAQDPEVRGGTSPYWTGDAYGIEVIVQAADGTTPRDVQLTLIDPGTSAADAVPGAPAVTDKANAAMTMPAIYSRAQWGADESLMGWDQEYAPTIKAATIHHTADSNDYTAADVPKIMRSIYAYHAVSLGWGDIGYNVIVDKFGRAWEGRSGGLASTVVGAHAGGFNYETFGVSMLGNYDIADTTPALIDTVAAVVAWKFSLYGVDPAAQVGLVSKGGGTSRYAAGVAVTVPTIFGHRDVGATACPGRYGYSHMGEIRTLVAAKMRDPALQEKIAPQVLLRNANTAGGADTQVFRGDPGDRPLACDWDGNGTETVGIYRRGHFFLFDSNAAAARPVADFWFGDVGDVPLCGDWDGDGRDSVGVWRAGWFFLRNDNAGGIAQGSFAFGNVNAQPVVGNWDGDPYDTVGVYQGNTFYYTNANIRPVAAGKVAFGAGSDRLVAGDWTGQGRDTIGVFRTGTFYLTNSLARSSTDAVVRYGATSDRSMVGDWDGDNIDTVGVNRGY
jgi:hypothetical protein